MVTDEEEIAAVETARSEGRSLTPADMHKIKMARRYGRKRVRLDEVFRKTMHQRRHMCKKPEVVESAGGQSKLNIVSVRTDGRQTVPSDPLKCELNWFDHKDLIGPAGEPYDCIHKLPEDHWCDNCRRKAKSGEES